MKNTAINIILGVAIAVLYVLHFISPGTQTKTSGVEENKAVEKIELNDTVKIPEGAVVFVNVDTVLESYDYYNKLLRDLQNEKQQVQSEMDAKAQSFQQKQADFQQKVQKGLLLRSEQQEIYNNLMREQQQLMQMNEQKQMALAEKEQVAMNKVLNNIQEYMKKHYSGKVKYVLGRAMGGGILYADEKLNITQNVINGLNNEYKDSLKATN